MSPKQDSRHNSDGGWGWVIVASVFFITFTSFGTMYSIGIAFDLLIDEFGCSKAEVSIMATINFSLQCFLGPVVSMLHDRFGTRPVVFCGCFVISLAFIGSAFAPNVVYLYFIFGIFGGVGMALAYLPGIIVISYYFEKKRTLATALGGIGGYAGCFIHPYLLRFFISIYGWRGTLFVIGGITLNSLAASLLLRPRPKAIRDKCDILKDISALRLEEFITENIAGCAEGRLDSVAEEIHPEENDEQSIPDVGILTQIKEGEIVDVFDNLTPVGSPPRVGKPDTKRAHSEMEVTGKRYALAKPPLVKRYTSAPTGSDDVKEAEKVSFRGRSTSRHRRPSMSRLTSFAGLYSHRVLASQLSLDIQRSIIDVPSGQASQIREKAQDQPDASFSEGKTTPSIKITSTAILPMFAIFKNPEFTVFIISNFMICLVFYIPALFIVDWGRQIGLDDDATTLLLSLVGIGNIIGRPLVAALGDLLPDHRILLFTLMVATTGVITGITPLFVSFHFLIFFVFQFAFLTGGSQVLLTPILADMVPLEKLGFAFGILIAAEGAAILIGPPLLALLPTYALSFNAAGLILLCSSVIMIVIVYASRFFCMCHLVSKAEQQSAAT